MIPDEYNQSPELIFAPVTPLIFSIPGEHYHTQLSSGQYTNTILADFKAEYQLSDNRQLIGSIVRCFGLYFHLRLNKDTWAEVDPVIRTNKAVKSQELAKRIMLTFLILYLQFLSDTGPF